MIVDALDNINQYKSLSANIYKGLKFLAEADPGIALGIHVIDENVAAIDIQYPIIGVERVKWSPLKGMKINIPYDKEKDRTFYIDPSIQGMNVDIGNGVFAIMFPGDAHSPQHFVDQPERIKKVTIKVKIQTNLLRKGDG